MEDNSSNFNDISLKNMGNVFSNSKLLEHLKLQQTQKVQQSCKKQSEIEKEEEEEEEPVEISQIEASEYENEEITDKFLDELEKENQALEFELKQLMDGTSPKKQNTRIQQEQALITKIPQQYSQDNLQNDSKYIQQKQSTQKSILKSNQENYQEEEEEEEDEYESEEEEEGRSQEYSSIEVEQYQEEEEYSMPQVQKVIRQTELDNQEKSLAIKIEDILIGNQDKENSQSSILRPRDINKISGSQLKVNECSSVQSKKYCGHDEQVVQQQQQSFRNYDKIQSLEMRLSGTSKALKEQQKIIEDKDEKIRKIEKELGKKEKLLNIYSNLNNKENLPSNSNQLQQSVCRKKEKELEKFIKEQEQQILDLKKQNSRVCEINQTLMKKIKENAESKNNKDLEIANKKYIEIKGKFDQMKQQMNSQQLENKQLKEYMICIVEKADCFKYTIEQLEKSIKVLKKELGVNSSNN